MAMTSKPKRVDPLMNIPIPVCSAYGAEWHCPIYPAHLVNGWALVYMTAGPHQVDAASQDDRVQVLPLVADPSVLAASVVTSSVATAPADVQTAIGTTGVTMASMLSKLAAFEPRYLVGLN